MGRVVVRLGARAIRDGDTVCRTPTGPRHVHDRANHAEASERDAQVPCETGATADGRPVETVGGTLEQMVLRRVNRHRVDWIYEGIRQRESEKGGVERETHSLGENDSRVKRREEIDNKSAREGPRRSRGQSLGMKEKMRGGGGGESKNGGEFI